MGACYSTSGGRRRGTGKGDDDEDDIWWQSKSGRKVVMGKNPTDLKFKFGGPAGRGGAAVAEERGFHQIPGRLFGSGATAMASLYTQQGKKGTNQDAMLFWENFTSTNNAVFCGVFDGHGPYGHMVARKVRDCLPVLLSTQWKASSSSGPNCVDENRNANGSTHDEELLEDKWAEQLEVDEKAKLPDMYQPLKRSMLRAFKLMDKELKSHPSIDCFCSGTTAVVLVKQGQDLILGNIGDSRAVLATRDAENSLVAVQLTVDLKPNLPREEARIKQFKGRVFALQDEPEVARVWLPNSDSPGLAMARAFGDFCLKDFGLISIPDVYYHPITDRDEFVVLATDGVWDVLSNKEVVDIVASAPSRSTASRALVDCATRAWRLKYPTSKIDDCAAVCLFLDHDPIPAVTIAKEEEETHAKKTNSVTVCNAGEDLDGEVATDQQPSVLDHSGTVRDGGDRHEIELDLESSTGEKVHPEKSPVGGSKRSLAECISTNEDEEWSALEGVVRVNSLLSLPRFLAADKRSASWRKATART